MHETEEKEYVMVPVVAAVVLKKDGKYLLVQERQPRAYKLWNFPAGKVDVGETVEQAAVREAKEEAGFDVKLVRKIGVHQDTAVEPPKHAYVGEIIGGELRFPPDEILDARWFALSEVEAMAKASQLRTPWVLEVVLMVENDH